MVLNQVTDVLNMGVVILDTRYTVVEWNRWMEIQSDIPREDMIGNIIFNQFPHMSNPSFLRGCKSVLNFGNFFFYSQKLHRYLFPFQATGRYKDHFENMQQSCTFTPIKDENNNIGHILITVQDVSENVLMERSLKTLTMMDSLTGINNRRYLDNRLKEQLMLAQRKNRPLSLLMIDIDDFKLVNDTYGHQFGDKVLSELALSYRNIIRGSDILARYGGEEFCIVLPETDGEGAMSFAERLRSLAEKQTITYGEDQKEVKITISIGAAQANKSIENASELIDRADSALYQSKKAGKNCVTFYRENRNSKSPT